MQVVAGRSPRLTSTVVRANAALALVALLPAVPLAIGPYLALAWITSGTTEGRSSRPGGHSP